VQGTNPRALRAAAQVDDVDATRESTQLAGAAGLPAESPAGTPAGDSQPQADRDGTGRQAAPTDGRACLPTPDAAPAAAPDSPAPATSLEAPSGVAGAQPLAAPGDDPISAAGRDVRAVEASALSSAQVGPASPR
jgi:hypothetical protein